MNGLLHLLARATRPPPRVGATPHDVVFAENKWRLLRYRARAEGLRYRTPVLMVPSLINRYYVLDLMPGKSLVEWLVAQGHDVFVIDWGTPGAEDRYVTFDDVVDRAFARALRVATKTSGASRAHVLGYCMGGTFTAIHAAVHPERIATLLELAAPIEFADAGLAAAWVRTSTFDPDAVARGFGNVPWQLMQLSFHLLRPTLGLLKAVQLLERAWDDEFLDGFLALEAWGNDNVSFPGECWKTYVQELYRQDALVRGELRLSGKPVDLHAIRCPTMVVTFEHDNIVPAASASVLLDRISSTDKQRLHLSGGHVGAVVSRSASTRLWPKLSEFWAERDSVREVKRATRIREAR